MTCIFPDVDILESDVEDERCCGSGTCIIDAEGACWCGQRWDGARMCFPEQGDHKAEDTPVKDAGS